MLHSPTSTSTEPGSGLWGKSAYRNHVRRGLYCVLFRSNELIARDGEVIRAETVQSAVIHPAEMETSISVGLHPGIYDRGERHDVV